MYAVQSPFLTVMVPSDHLTSLLIPLYSNSVPAGFPSPAEDHVEQGIDLNTELIRHPSATFFVRVQGQSMQDAGIDSGDLLVVDRSLDAESGSVVVCSINGEFTLKRLKIIDKTIWLIPANPAFKPTAVPAESDFKVFGVVAHVIKSMKSK